MPLSKREERHESGGLTYIDYTFPHTLSKRNKFSKHGGMQLLFDIDQGICGKMGFKMFASSTRSESNYFKRIRDVCGLLARPLKRSSTSVSSAQISSNSSTLPTISEIIEQIEQNEKGAEEGWLLEILGIYRLRLEEVLDVIQRRSDIS